MTGNATKKAFALAVASLLLSACASLPEDEAAWRAYEKQQHKQRFIAFRNACFDAGGTVIVQASQRLGPDAVPFPGDRYFCG